MLNFDKQRIENAIWVLKQYEDEVRELAKLGAFIDNFDCDSTFAVLDEVQEYLRNH